MSETVYHITTVGWVATAVLIAMAVCAIAMVLYFWWDERRWWRRYQATVNADSEDR